MKQGPNGDPADVCCRDNVSTVLTIATAKSITMMTIIATVEILEKLSGGITIVRIMKNFQGVPLQGPI